MRVRVCVCEYYMNSVSPSVPGWNLEYQRKWVEFEAIIQLKAYEYH